MLRRSILFGILVGGLVLISFLVIGCISKSKEDGFVVATATVLGRQVILENDKIALTILPDLGGRIYKFFWKETGHEQMYQNAAWRGAQGWGINGCRNGYYTAIGGVEYSFPFEEHGCVYDRKFNFEEFAEGVDTKGVRLTYGPDPLSSLGMRLTVEIRLYGQSPVFRISSKIENLTADNQRYQYWINAALNPGGLDPRDADIEFVYPPNISQMIYHGGASTEPLLTEMTPGALNPWPGLVNLYDQFSESLTMGWFASSLVNWQAIYSHERNEGIVRIYSSPQGGKFFALGPASSQIYSAVDRQFLEMWSGLTRDFWQFANISPGQVVELSELWVPFQLSDGNDSVTNQVDGIVRSF